MSDWEAAPAAPSGWTAAIVPPSDITLSAPPKSKSAEGVPEKILDWRNIVVPGVPKTQTRAQQQRQAAAERMGVLGGISLGAGKEIGDLVTGTQQALNFGDPARAKQLQSEYELGNRVYEPFAKERPISTIVGESLPYYIPGAKAYDLAGKGLQFAARNNPVMRGAITPAKQAALGEAGLGALAGAVHPGYDPAQGAAMGAIGGYLGGKVGMGLSQRPTELTAQDKVMIDYAKKRPGFKLLPGDKTRMDAYMREDQSLIRNTHTQKPYIDIEISNKQILNRDILSATGMEDTMNVTADIIEEHENLLSDRYKEMISVSQGKFDNRILGKFDKAVKTAERRMKKDSRYLNAYYNELDNLSNKNLDISGEGYQQLYSDLTDQIRKKYRSTSANAKTEADALRSMRNALVDNVEEGLPDGMKGEWKKLRSEYAATRLILDNNAIDTRGNINYKKLASVLKRKENRKNFQRESGPWQEMIEATKIGEWRASKPSYLLGGRSTKTANTAKGAKRTMAGLMFGKGAELPFTGRLMSMMYRSGYPHLTGAMNLPPITAKYTGLLGSSSLLGQQD